MPYKPGVAGSIPGFSIKPLSVEPSGVPVILINTQIINPPGPVLVSTHGKATKSSFFLDGPIEIDLGPLLLSLRACFAHIEIKSLFQKTNVQVFIT